MAFKPYNHQRYQNIGQRNLSTLVSAEISLNNYFLDTRAEAEAAMRRQQEEQYWYDSFLQWHRNQQEAIDANGGNELVLGRQPCQKASGSMSGNW